MMNGKSSNPKNNSYTAVAASTTSTQADTIQPRRRIMQNYLIIWLYSKTNETNGDYQKTLAHLPNIANDVYLFTNTDECIDFLTEVDDQKVFMIISGNVDQHLVVNIHEIPQLQAVYIYCSKQTQHEQCVKDWSKVSVDANITSVFTALQKAVMQCNQDSIPVSFVPTTAGGSDQILDQLEPSFMYTQIFKEILLDMEYSQQSIDAFTAYCRSENHGSLTNINRFGTGYRFDLAIWWYTYPSFIFSMLNGALRTLESATIVKMGFFIHDLHCQIENLYRQQHDEHHGKVFIVYRGQGLSKQDFEKLQNAKGGLLSFNNFLSTSEDREFSCQYAMCALTKTDSVGILFRMTIDPSISSTPFALIDKVSYFKTEQEVLFSMHTIFRIGEIKKIHDNDPLYEVELKLTADDDIQLRKLTEQIRKETFPDDKGWHRMGELLTKLGHFDLAEQIYSVVLQQTTDAKETAKIYHQLGVGKHYRSDYKEAISFHEKALEIYKKNLRSNHPWLATSYDSISMAYIDMGEYRKALSFYEKAFEIKKKNLPPDHPDLANFYNNIGGIYDDMGEYSQALSFYKKALKIRQKTLPANHPDLANSYNNIGGIYNGLGEYSKALSFHEKALEICQKALPSNHHNLATPYNNIASVYDHMGEYSKALSFYEKALEICQKALPSNHPLLASSYNNIASVYNHMGEYSKAFSFYEKALEIFEKTLPSNHPSLATSYNNIGFVHYNMKECYKALSFYKKALEIRQKTLPANHLSLATSYNNIGLVYDRMGEYSKALSFYEKALEIFEKTLPSNHPSLATSYNNIGFVYRNMKEYSKALSFYEKALEIFEKTLPSNHPHLQSVRQIVAIVRRKL